MDKQGKVVRITGKSLTKLVQDLCDKIELPCTVIECVRTRFTSDQYEGGAAKQYIRIKFRDSGFDSITMLCFYSKKEIEDCLRLGYRLSIKPPCSHRRTYDWELDVIK